MIRQEVKAYLYTLQSSLSEINNSLEIRVVCVFITSGLTCAGNKKEKSF